MKRPLTWSDAQRKLVRQVQCSGTDVVKFKPFAEPWLDQETSHRRQGPALTGRLPTGGLRPVGRLNDARALRADRNADGWSALDSGFGDILMEKADDVAQIESVVLAQPGFSRLEAKTVVGQADSVGTRPWRNCGAASLNPGRPSRVPISFAWTKIVGKPTAGANLPTRRYSRALREPMVAQTEQVNELAIRDDWDRFPDAEPSRPLPCWRASWRPHERHRETGRGQGYHADFEDPTPSRHRAAFLIARPRHDPLQVSCGFVFLMLRGYL